MNVSVWGGVLWWGGREKPTQQRKTVTELGHPQTHGDLRLSNHSLLLFQLHANLQARAEGTGVDPEGPPPPQDHEGNMRACLLFTPCMCNFGLHYKY